MSADRLHHFMLHCLHVASTWKDLISACGTAVAALGFLLAAFQIYRATLTLRASNGYQIQKDSREIMNGLVDDKDFNTAVLDGKALKKEAAKKLVVVMQFYLSVYRQYRARGLNRSLARSFAGDFARLWKIKSVRATVIADLKASYDSRYLEMIRDWVSRDEYETLKTLMRG